MSDRCDHWIEKFKEDFFQRGSSQTTWNGDYWKILKHLPMKEPLTAAALHELITNTAPNTKTRKRACMVTRQIAKFADIDYDPRRYEGKYSPDSVDPRSIPSDEVIVREWIKLKNPAWQWVFGILAAYGLRPHEAFRLDFDLLRSGDRIVQVQQNTKTGRRTAWAYHPEWFEAFDLRDVQIPLIKLGWGTPTQFMSASITVGLIERFYNLHTIAVS